MDEKMLIERAQKGDTRAFEQLVREYGRLIYGTALRLCKNEHDAQDAAQEVFIKLYKSLGSFKFQSSFSTYLYRITSNVCMDFVRKRGEVFSTDEAGFEVADSAARPDTQFEKKERKEIFERALSSLSYEHREMITLRDINGLSYKEIADITGLPENTVKTRILRARKNLCEILRQNGNYFNNFSSNKAERGRK